MQTLGHFFEPLYLRLMETTWFGGAEMSWRTRVEWGKIMGMTLPLLSLLESLALLVSVGCFRPNPSDGWPLNHFNHQWCSVLLLLLQRWKQILYSLQVSMYIFHWPAIILKFHIGRTTLQIWQLGKLCMGSQSLDPILIRTFTTANWS